MNSAGRLHKLLCHFVSGNVVFETVFREKYSIDTTNRIEVISFVYTINKEIEQLYKDLETINKHNKYKKDIDKLYTIFDTRPINTNINGILSTVEIGKLIVRLESLEDLLESANISENMLEEEKISDILNSLELLIEKLTELNDEESVYISKILKEIISNLKTYKVNGIKTIEKSLEKLFCKSKFILEYLPDEYKKDFNSLLGNLYGIWTLTKKYGKKPIEYAKKQFDEKQLEETILDAEIQE